MHSKEDFSLDPHSGWSLEQRLEADAAAELQQAVMGSFAPSRLFMRLAGPPEDYLPGADGKEASIEHEATLAHEMFHFHQTLFSGYGQLSWQMHRQRASWVIRVWS